MSRERVRFRDVVREARSVRALRATRYGLAPLVVLLAVDFFQQFDTGAFGLLGPEIRKDLGVSLAALGWAGGIAASITLLMSLPIGWVTDRSRRTRLLGITALASGVSSMITGTARGLAQLTAMRVVDTTGESAGNIPANALYADYYPVEARGKMYAFRALVQRGASLVAPVSIGAMAAVWGWRMPFFVAGPCLALAGACALVVLREPIRGYWERRALGVAEERAVEEEPPISLTEATRTILGTRTLRRLFFAVALLLVSAGWFGFLFNFFLLEQYHLNAFQRSLVNVPSGVVAIAAVFLGGGLVDLVVRRRPGRMLTLLGVGVVVNAVVQLLTVLVPSLGVMVGLRMADAAFGSVLAPATATVFSLVIPPRMRGQGLAVFAMAALPGQLLAGVPGVLEQSFGLRNALLLCTPLLMAAGLLAMSAASFFEADMRTAIAAANAGEEYRRARLAGRNKLLVCRDVDVSYGSVQVLFGVDFDLSEGEVLALLGTNGAGKSTLLRAVSGVQQAGRGAILLDGRDITALPPYEIARLGVAHMPGGRAVFPGLTVAENLDLSLWAVPEGERAARQAEVFARFPVLQERLGQEAGLLSGGEQQMLGLAQAFLARPRVLLIDELSLGLSPALVGRLLDDVRALAALGTSVVLVEQSVHVALAVADRAVFMEKGQVRFEGAAADLLARPDLVRAVYVRGTAALAVGSGASSRAGERGRPLLGVEHVTKRYGGKVALNDVSLVVHEGESLGLIGPNGAGKTTLFDVISGYQPADAGRVVFDGLDVTARPPDARARLRLVRRFQDARLFPSLTVLETLCLALERHLDVRNTFVLATQLPAVRKSEARARRGAERLIELLELGDYRDAFVSELSTGLRRIVDLACVLAAEPRLLLLDEPSAGIAQAEAETLGPLLRRVRQETGASLLVIEHDMALLTSLADEVVAMVEGAVVVQGPADEVLSHPVVVEAYLGRDSAAIWRHGEAAR